MRRQWKDTVLPLHFVVTNLSRTGLGEQPWQLSGHRLRVAHADTHSSSLGTGLHSLILAPLLLCGGGGGHPVLRRGRPCWKIPSGPLRQRPKWRIRPRVTVSTAGMLTGNLLTENADGIVPRKAQPHHHLSVFPPRLDRTRKSFNVLSRYFPLVARPTVPGRGREAGRQAGRRPTISRYLQCRVPGPNLAAFRGVTVLGGSSPADAGVLSAAVGCGLWVCGV